MRRTLVEVKGELKDYTDKLGNRITGKITGEGSIIFSGQNACICCSGEVYLGKDSYIQMEDNATLDLGNNVHMDHNCEFVGGYNSKTEIGEESWFNAYMVMYNWSGNCSIGDGCRFGRFNLLAVCAGDRIELGKGCLTARNVSIMSKDGHPIFDVNTGKQINQGEDCTLRLGEHVWCGNGAIIMAECDVGRNCMIGANSFVRNKVFANNCMIAGNPARVIRKDIAWNSSYVNDIKEINQEYVELTEQRGDRGENV